MKAGSSSSNQNEPLKKVKIYDTTLRDGAQREGISFTVEDKIKIALELDRLGVHYIEGGFPAANVTDRKFFQKASELNLANSQLVAFGRTCLKDMKAEDDENLKALVQSGCQVVCIFGKSWDLHVSNVLVTTLDENLRMIADSISFLKKAGFETIFDAEHFFDGYKNNREYALKTLKVAQDAGADWIVLCDTNGGALPSEVREIIKAVKKEVQVPLGIHAHNDSECAVANSLVAVDEGVTMVQGTINGYGERCGNANLCSIIPTLVLKKGLEAVPQEKLSLLTEVSHYVAEVANLAPDSHQPYVGQSAFAHKGGVHISAVLREKGAYEHIDPQLVGNAQRILVSEQAGRQTIVTKAKEVAHVDLSNEPEKIAAILEKLKKREHQGYHYEVADGSFALFILKNIGKYKPFFRIESYDVRVERGRTQRLETEAVVKVWVGQERKVEVAEGNGPVNALDRALRRALQPFYPKLSQIKLVDFKVRVFDSKKGTGATTRVFVESTDGVKNWGTVGVSENIIEASWEALVDSIEYGLLFSSELTNPSLFED
jgi:2-isopropylmalate synthase